MHDQYRTLKVKRDGRQVAANPGHHELGPMYMKGSYATLSGVCFVRRGDLKAKRRGCDRGGLPVLSVPVRCLPQQLPWRCKQTRTHAHTHAILGGWLAGCDAGAVRPTGDDCLAGGGIEE